MTISMVDDRPFYYGNHSVMERRQLIYEVCDLIFRLYYEHFKLQHDTSWTEWSLQYADDINYTHFKYELKAMKHYNEVLNPMVDCMANVATLWQKLLDTDDVIHMTRVRDYVVRNKK